MGPEDRRPAHRCNAVRDHASMVAGPFLFPGGGWFLGRLVVRGCGRGSGVLVVHAWGTAPSARRPSRCRTSPPEPSHGLLAPAPGAPGRLRCPGRTPQAGPPRTARCRCTDTRFIVGRQHATHLGRLHPRQPRTRSSRESTNAVWLARRLLSSTQARAGVPRRSARARRDLPGVTPPVRRCPVAPA